MRVLIRLTAPRVVLGGDIRCAEAGDRGRGESSDKARVVIPKHPPVWLPFMVSRAGGVWRLIFLLAGGGIKRMRPLMQSAANGSSEPNLTDAA